jgi:hypothetical protein
MAAVLALAAMAAAQGQDEVLVFRGTAATAGEATATFDINGCEATASVNVALNATAASTCTALANGLTGQCELNAALVAQLEARQAAIQVELDDLAAQMRLLQAERDRVARRLQQAASADPYVVFACGVYSGWRTLGKLGGEAAELTDETVSDRGYEVRP